MDGVYSSYIDHCTHTANEDAPWWSVDLGQVYTVRHVRLLNRDTLGKLCSVIAIGLSKYKSNSNLIISVAICAAVEVQNIGTLLGTIFRCNDNGYGQSTFSQLLCSVSKSSPELFLQISHVVIIFLYVVVNCIDMPAFFAHAHYFTDCMLLGPV